MLQLHVSFMADNASSVAKNSYFDLRPKVSREAYIVFSVNPSTQLCFAQDGVWEIRVKEAYSISKTTTDFAGSALFKLLPSSSKLSPEMVFAKSF